MTHATYEEWLASRPKLVREVLTKFPPMTTVLLDEKMHYVIGADEEGSLIVSPVNPNEDYSGALDAQRVVCREHQADLKVIAYSKQEKPFGRGAPGVDALLAEIKDALVAPFTAAELRTILKALAPEGGYSKELAVARLQAKLSIMLEAADDLEAGAVAHDPGR